MFQTLLDLKTEKIYRDVNIHSNMLSFVFRAGMNVASMAEEYTIRVSVNTPAYAWLNREQRIRNIYKLVKLVKV